MSTNDVLKAWRELPDAVDLENGRWTWGRGGHPFEDWDYHISYVYDDCHADVYVLPKFLSRMLRQQEQHGQDEARRTIRNALGV